MEIDQLNNLANSLLDDNLDGKNTYLIKKIISKIKEKKRNEEKEEIKDESKVGKDEIGKRKRREVRVRSGQIGYRLYRAHG